MKHPILVPSACIVILAALLLTAGCTTQPPSVTPPATAATIVTPGQSACGFTTCHGLDLACGTNAPEFCTMEYRLGDKCRQYAQCTAGSSGSCTLVKSPQFDTCKSCVEQCEKTSVNDPSQAFACEAKC